MTVSNNVARDQYTATSSQTVFTYTFQIDDETEISVWQRSAAATPNDAADLLTLTTEYTVTGVGNASGGTIVLVTGATSGDIITIESSIAAQRDTSFTTAGIIQAADLNTEFDNEVLIYQRLLTRAQQRTPTYPASAIIDPDRDCIMPILGVKQVWRMNEAGTGVEAFTLGEGSANQLQADLASNAAGEGASLIGLENQGLVNEKTVQDLAEATFIVQTNNGSLLNAQALGDLSTGILKSTATSGLVSISVPLTSIDGLTTAANKMIYTTASNVYATTDLTAFARTLLDDADAATAAATLEVLPLSGGTMTGALILASDPTTGLQAATKQYVDDIAFNTHPACIAATTANLAGYTYDNGASGVGATLTAGSNGAFLTDGASPSVNARILVKDQSTQAQNGIYTLSTVGDGSNPAILTRATDFDTSSDIQAGDRVSVVSGTLFSTTTWMMTQTSAITVGTTAITWEEQSIAAITPLSKGGTGAALTADNGAIFYSNASTGALLAATATANLALVSGSNAAPSWSSFPPFNSITIQRVTATGAGTYTPSAGMVAVMVCCQGGGGGGGGASATGAGEISFGAGGGGGEYIEALFTAAQIGASKPYVVGAGGAGGTGGSSGAAGVATTFNSSWVIAERGLAGGTAAPFTITGATFISPGGNRGTGGSVSTGSLVKQSRGHDGGPSLVYRGTSAVTSGFGGDSGSNSSGGRFQYLNNAGDAGVNGSGGSGALSKDSGGAQNGGNGGDGFITFIEYKFL